MTSSWHVTSYWRVASWHVMSTWRATSYWRVTSCFQPSLFYKYLYIFWPMVGPYFRTKIFNERVWKFMVCRYQLFERGRPRTMSVVPQWIRLFSRLSRLPIFVILCSGGQTLHSVIPRCGKIEHGAVCTPSKTKCPFPFTHYSWHRFIKPPWDRTFLVNDRGFQVISGGRWPYKTTRCPSVRPHFFIRLNWWNLACEKSLSDAWH